MQKIELIFPSDFIDSELVRALSREGSGFERDAHQPLDSGFENAIAVAGAVLSAAQLGVAIWALMIQRAERAGRPVKECTPVQIRRIVDGQLVSLPTENPQVISKAIEDLTTPKE